MNWTITNDGKDLNLNEKTFIGEDFADFSQPYSAPQIPSGVPDSMIPYFMQTDSADFFKDGATQPVSLHWQELGFRASRRQVSATDETEDQLIDIDFEILQVNSRSPTGVDALTLRLLQNEKGILNLLEVVRIPADGSVPTSASDEPSKNEDEEESFEILPISPIPSVPNGEPGPAIKQRPPHIVNCHSLPLKICKIQYVLRKKIEAMHRAFSAALSGDSTRTHRPCGGMRGSGPQGINIKGGVPKFTRPDGTPIVRPLRHHGHHSVVHKVFRFMRRSFFGFVVPVMIGVAAGMTASLAGMLVGTCLAMLWFKFRRGGRRGQANAAIVEEGEQYEREGLISKEEEALAEPRDSEETLPAYEEKPSQPL